MTNETENLTECTECGVICEPYEEGLGECEECFHEGCKEHGHPCADWQWIWRIWSDKNRK